MTEICVKVGSVTNAQKGKRVLNHHGYSCKIRRALSIRKGDGCGYMLQFTGDEEAALHLLRRAGVRIISVEVL